MNVHSLTANDHGSTRPRAPIFGRTLAALGCLLAAGTAAAGTWPAMNMPVGVTVLSRDIYHLHMEILWICVAIATVVFGVMIVAMIRFRHSRGAVPDTAMTHSTKAEIIWTIIPVLILVAMAIPATKGILQIENMGDSGLTIRITGYQWKWQYTYLGKAAGISFFSTLSQSSNFASQLHSGIDPRTVPHYLLSVDHPLVIPSGVKVRLLLTSADVIHAWWVPDFGVKRSAIPGFINELWVKVLPGKEGVYRGQCAALCGRGHAFMPIVVDVKTPAAFDKWVAQQQAALKQAATAAPNASSIAKAPNDAPVAASAAPAHATAAAVLARASRPLTAQILD
ncbi:MAG TPA: cytochrome c oxidase subunit II [Steroidobacteraceae bacterium]|nr:cytochrome c oxidase subunit II [Steroidobacteraceae bacterium]